MGPQPNAGRCALQHSTSGPKPTSYRMLCLLSARLTVGMDMQQIVVMELCSAHLLVLHSKLPSRDPAAKSAKGRVIGVSDGRPVLFSCTSCFADVGSCS